MCHILEKGHEYKICFTGQPWLHSYVGSSFSSIYLVSLSSICILLFHPLFLLTWECWRFFSQDCLLFCNHTFIFCTYPWILDISSHAPISWSSWPKYIFIQTTHKTKCTYVRSDSFTLTRCLMQYKCHVEGSSQGWILL